MTQILPLTPIDEDVQALAHKLGKFLNLRVEKTNDKAYTLWDNYEALIGIVNYKGDVGLSFSYSLEKLSLATVVLNATKMYPQLILCSPFYFDYRDNMLYRNVEARVQYEDAEFFYALQHKAQGGKIE